jgi:hypothetical protein
MSETAAGTRSFPRRFLVSGPNREDIMRNLAMAGATGLFLMIRAASADSQTPPFRPAIDGIGNAEPPAAEAASGAPEGVEFGADDRGVRHGRGRVTIDSATARPAGSHWGRRKI